MAFIVQFVRHTKKIFSTPVLDENNCALYTKDPVLGFVPKMSETYYDYKRSHTLLVELDHIEDVVPFFERMEGSDSEGSVTIDIKKVDSVASAGAYIRKTSHYDANAQTFSFVTWDVGFIASVGRGGRFDAAGIIDRTLRTQHGHKYAEMTVDPIKYRKYLLGVLANADKEPLYSNMIWEYERELARHTAIIILTEIANKCVA